MIPGQRVATTNEASTRAARLPWMNAFMYSVRHFEDRPVFS
jgi:hypothetical protein